MKFKVLAANPSADQPLKSKIRQDLPVEIKPEDVLDKAGMDVQYDPERKTHFLVGEVELKPHETRVFEVKIRNVWVIPPEELEQVRSQLEANAESLKGTKYEQTAGLIKEKAMETLSHVEEEEAMAVGIKQKIELYRAHVRQLEELKANLFSIAEMNRMKEEAANGVRAVKYVITAENPSDKETTMTIRALLPKDLHQDDVLNKLDFNLIYDESQKRFGVEKKEKFGPKENKKYTITLRDIWYIPQAELDQIGKQTGKLLELFEDSPYESFATQRGDFIKTSLAEIKQLQEEIASSPLEDRMRAYVLNSQKLELVRRRLRELQDMSLELKLKPDLGKLSYLRRLFVKKILNAKKLVLVAMGLQPDKPITLILLLGIAGFLSLMSVLLYVTWLKKLQQNPFAKSPEKGARPDQKAAA